MHQNIWIDGGARGNPGLAAAGVVIRNEQGEKLFAGGFYLGSATNNQAEYQALLHGLDWAKKLGGSKLKVFCDSELLVKQINGQYRVKNSALKKLYQQADERIAGFVNVMVEHVYRSDNFEADALVNQSLDFGANVGGVIETTESTRKDIKSRTMAKSRPKLVNLTEKVHFKNSEPCRTTLQKDSKLISELICLQSQQKCQIPGNWSQATITVVQGRGKIQTYQQEQILLSGSWLHLASGSKLEIAADTNESLVIIITYLI